MTETELRLIASAASIGPGEILDGHLFRAIVGDHTRDLG